MERLPGIVMLMALLTPLPGQGAAPLMRDLMGVNGHTVQFRPALYAPVCRLVRDYHPIDWDFGDNTSARTAFPMAGNGVDWGEVYGSWRKEGFTTDACLMFDQIGATGWRDPAADARAYGEAFARAFGPSSASPLVTSAEVGNEPGKYDDPLYRRLFRAMAEGLRAGDSKMTVLPCALTTTKSGEYSKSVGCLDGLGGLYDALNIHCYALAEGWPTWRRSFPEDPSIRYLDEIREMLAWRDAHAPGKPVWVTEFGWDAGTKEPPATGDFSKWQDVTDEQQAQYLVRSFLVFARLGVARAYVYFFNDEDEPQFHGSSGLTRHFAPKPAYHAVAHLLATLGDYRFDRVIAEEAGKIYAYRFMHAAAAGKAAVAVWAPTGKGVSGSFDLDPAGFKVTGVTVTPLAATPAPAPKVRTVRGRLRIPFGESPVFVLLERR